MRRLVEDEAHWNAFGFIGAEAELTRAKGPCAAQAGGRTLPVVSLAQDRRCTRMRTARLGRTFSLAFAATIALFAAGGLTAARPSPDAGPGPGTCRY